MSKILNAIETLEYLSQVLNKYFSLALSIYWKEDSKSVN